MDGTNSFDLLTEKGNHQAHHQTDRNSKSEAQEDDGIIAFISKLSFDLSDTKREAFFSELEAILANSAEEKPEDNPALYKFFVKYAV